MATMSVLGRDVQERVGELASSPLTTPAAQEIKDTITTALTKKRRVRSSPASGTRNQSRKPTRTTKDK